MEKQESKRRFPAFPQPRRLRTITTYGIRILRARSHRSHLVTSQLGSPQALLLSSDNRTLFIADALQRKIYRLDLSNANAVPAVFSADRVFQEPVGLARLSSGAIVVADDRANALFVLSPQGKVVGK